MPTDAVAGPIPVPGDAVALTQALVAVDSRNPDLVPGAPGEAQVAHRLAGILESWGFRVDLEEAAPGRPNVIARIGSTSGDAPVLMFNGHLDVVDVAGMIHAPFEATVKNGRIYGRGSSDMKSGIASMCSAAWRASHDGSDASFVVTAVVDEEFASIGTRALMARGIRADACIVTEPTRLAIAPAHRGFTWVEVTVHGRAAHGSRYDVGIDAIRHAGYLLSELDQLDVSLEQETHPLLGHASIHASTIEGGNGWSTYPDSCTIRMERRTLPARSSRALGEAVQEVVDACDRVRARVPSFQADVKHVFTQLPSDVPVDAPLVGRLASALQAEGEPVVVEGLSAWTDAALINAAGTPAICFGPGDIGMAHSAEEWVSIDEIERATAVLTRLAREWSR